MLSSRLKGTVNIWLKGFRCEDVGSLRIEVADLTIERASYIS